MEESQKHSTFTLAIGLEKFFNCKIVGSAVFVKEQMLEESDINDVDAFVPADWERNVRHYLSTLDFEVAATQPDAESFVRYISPKFDKPLDITDKKSLAQSDVFVLMKFKYERSYKDDLNQLEKIIQNKQQKST